ncbi:MAG TPA: hypothetical protein VKB86_12495 [Pyrinomonadaceae bacterium]|nr:hypothetical protein [Pyrinomonadaceae bacterium]
MKNEGGIVERGALAAYAAREGSQTCERLDKVSNDGSRSCWSAGICPHLQCGNHYLYLIPDVARLAIFSLRLRRKNGIIQTISKD